MCNSRSSSLTSFSPNDLELREVGSDVGEERSDSAGTPTLEIRHPPSPQQNQEPPGHTAGPQVPLSPDPEQQRVSPLRRQPTCWQQRPRGAPRKRLRKGLSPPLSSREEGRGKSVVGKQYRPQAQRARAGDCGGGAGRAGGGACFRPPAGRAGPGPRRGGLRGAGGEPPLGV